MVRSAANDNHYRLAAFNFTNDRLTQCLKLALEEHELEPRNEERKKRSRVGLEGYTTRKNHKEPEEYFTTLRFSFASIFRTGSRSPIGNTGVIKSSGRSLDILRNIYLKFLVVSRIRVSGRGAKQFDQFEKA